MVQLPDQMTDAAYRKALRDTERRLTRMNQEHMAACAAWNTASLKTCGLRNYFATWVRVRRSARQVQDVQDHLFLLYTYKKERRAG